MSWNIFRLFQSKHFYQHSFKIFPSIRKLKNPLLYAHFESKIDDLGWLSSAKHQSNGHFVLDFLSFDMVEREEMEETSIKMPSHLDNGRFFTLQFHINNCRT